jgi:hypothetical protein
MGVRFFAVGFAGPVDAGPIAAQCPASPSFSFVHADPVGDIIASGSNTRDILSVDVAGDSQTLCVSVSFAVPVDPAFTKDYFGVQIGFDTDEDARTGVSFGTAWFQPS